MDALTVHFPVSGVDTSLFMPPLVAFVVSFFSSMGGVSGAFFLLPYQVSVLNFVSPSVTSTNFVFNIVAIPSGVYRYMREGRLAWPLAGIIVAGTLPGVLLGYYLRVSFLPDPRIFRLFIGCVLLYIAVHLLYATFSEYRTGATPKPHTIPGPPAGAGPGGGSGDTRRRGACRQIRTVAFSVRKIDYAFGGETFSVGIPALFTVALVVGIIGGAYGIGGGSILAPFCVAVLKLPVYTVAGAALLGTFLTSIAGVVLYSLIPARAGLSTTPDWMLGILFGIGGIFGMYCGARLQKHVPQAAIKTMLAAIMLLLACRYILEYLSA